MAAELLLAVLLGLAAPTQPDGCAFIRRAIEQLPATGGRVEVPAGTFTCRRPIVIDRDDVWLRGQGPATLLRLADGAECPLIVAGGLDPQPDQRRRIRITDLRIDGNAGAQAHECWGGPCDGVVSADRRGHLRNNGITLRQVHGALVARVTISRARSAGLVSERGTRRLTVRDVTASDNTFDGVAAYDTELSLFTGLQLHDNGAAGLSFDNGFHRNVISDAIVSGSATVGIFLRHARDNVFRGLQVHDSGEHGIFLADHDEPPARPALGNVFLGCVVTGSGRLSSDLAPGHGLRINDASCLGNRLAHCRFTGQRGRCVSTEAPAALQDIDCER